MIGAFALPPIPRYQKYAVWILDEVAHPQTRPELASRTWSLHARSLYLDDLASILQVRGAGRAERGGRENAWTAWLSTIWGRALLPEAMGVCLCNAESMECSLPAEKTHNPESVPGPLTQGDQAKNTIEGLTRGERLRETPDKHRASEAEPNVGVERRS